MQKLFTILSTLVLMFFFSSVVSAQLFTEDFESGTPDPNWGVFYAGEDELAAVPMSTPPDSLASGGNYVGWIQDLDGSYSGSAVAINGSSTLTDYSIEADVYCYVNHPDGSAYTGLVVYADTSKWDFYKLRADFDVSDRINFSGLRSDTITYLPLFSVDFKGIDNPGIFPTADGWHNMKIEVRGTSATETSFWCYFDGNLLTGCPIIDTNSTRNTSGSFGLYTFQMGGPPDGIPGYFDNIVVSPVTSVEDNSNGNLPEEFSLEQNYPNPFNPSTQISYKVSTGNHVSLTIHDLLGREIKTLVSGFQPAGHYSVTWNGKDELGNIVPSGVYLYSLHSGGYVISKKMMLMK